MIARWVEEHPLAPHRLRAFEAAGEIQRHDVSGLDDLSIVDRAQLGDRLAQRFQHAIDLVVGDARGGPDDVEARHVPERDVRTDVHRRGVTERLARSEHVGVDLRRADHREVMLVDGVVERFLHQTPEDLATHLLAEHVLQHATWRLARPESG